MKNLPTHFAATFILAAELCSSTGCSTHSIKTASPMSEEPAPAQPADSKRFRTGRSMTVMQDDGAIIGFTVGKVEGDVIHGVTPAGSRVAIPIASLRSEADAEFPGPNQERKDGVTYHLLGAFANIGKYGGKVALTGLLVPGAVLLNGADSVEAVAETFGEIWSED